MRQGERAVEEPGSHALGRRKGAEAEDVSPLSLSPPLSPPLQLLSLTGILPNSFRTPEIQPSPRIYRNDTILADLHMRNCGSNRLSCSIDLLVVVAAELFPGTIL
jgi:hypothetical protein